MSTKIGVCLGVMVGTTDPAQDSPAHVFVDVVTEEPADDPVVIVNRGRLFNAADDGVIPRPGEIYHVICFSC